jgi:hypothetical protein
MAWKPGYNAPLGLPPMNPTTVDPAAVVPVGTIATFVEDTLNLMGEFIYLPGVAATIAGDVVEYDLTPGAAATIRHTNATGSNSGRPLAVAMAAVLATQFGWYQIGGVCVINTTAAQAAGNVFGTATAGAVGNTLDAGDQILNARLLTATGTPAALKAYALIQRPFVQGNIT